MEAKLKHLEMIDAIINRMGKNSFLLKGWALTLVAALWTLYAKEALFCYWLIGVVQIFFFWGLDAYYLTQERRFRFLYDAVRQKKEAEIDFSMKIDKAENGKDLTFVSSLLSITELLFYGMMAVSLAFLFFFNRKIEICGELSLTVPSELVWIFETGGNQIVSFAWSLAPAVITACVSYKIYKLSAESSEEHIRRLEEKYKLEQVRQVLPIIYDQKCGQNKVGIRNYSDYPIFDVIVVQGINSTPLEEGKGVVGRAKYYRVIYPKENPKIEMENKGLGMCKFMVLGIFFRDYLGNEWFRDSYGKFKEKPGYKEMLRKEGVIFPPYSDSGGEAEENMRN